MQLACVTDTEKDLIAGDPGGTCGQCQRAANVFEYESRLLLASVSGP